jgi:hypothetical protein
MKSSIPLWKVAATAGGAALTGAAVWLNAEHIAHAEGWRSPLVLAGVLTTICAALTRPAAERCAKDGQPLKAVCLWAFFALAVAFSLSASIGRAGGHRDGQVADGEAANLKAQLAREAYDSAAAAVKAECIKRGSLCRNAEAALAVARAGLGVAPAARAADPGAERIANVLGVSQASVALYSPLALPFALELGGFIFLAVGLAPRRRKIQDAAVPKLQNPSIEGIYPAKPIAKALPAPAKAGTRAYYLQRLEREFPRLAQEVAAGAMSVYAATVMAGLRKPALA